MGYRLRRCHCTGGDRPGGRSLLWPCVSI